MGIAASDLRQHVIRPTLMYLGRHSPSAEALLLGVAACQSALGAVLTDRRGHGLYRIAEQRHQHIWDQHLALDPDLASKVRGLASQHAFLTAPHLELTVNLRYSTAIAWMLIEADNAPLPEADDLLGLARVWRRVFHPQGRLQERERVFTGGFPHLVKDFIPSHLIPVIPTAGGEAKVAAAHAADRVRQGGGGRTRSQGFNRGVTSTGTGNHAQEMRSLGFAPRCSYKPHEACA